MRWKSKVNKMTRMQVDTIEVRRFKLGLVLGILVTSIMFWAELHVTWNIGLASLGVHPFGAFANHQEYIFDGLLSIIRWPGSGEAWNTYYQTMQESGLVDSFVVHLLYPFGAALLCGLITMYVVARKRTVILREYPQKLLPHDNKPRAKKADSVFESLMPNSKPVASSNPKMQERIIEKVKEGILLKNDPDQRVNPGKVTAAEQKKASQKRVVEQIRQDKQNLRDINNQRRLRTSSSKFAKPTMEAPKVPRREYDYNYVPKGNPLQWPVNPAKVTPGEQIKQTVIPRELLVKETVSSKIERPQQKRASKVEQALKEKQIRQEKQKKSMAQVEKVTPIRQDNIELQAEMPEKLSRKSANVEKLFVPSNDDTKITVETIADKNPSVKINGTDKSSNIEKAKAVVKDSGPRRLILNLTNLENKKSAIEVEIAQTPEERRLMAESKSLLAQYYGVDYDSRYRRKEAQYLTGEISEMEFNDWLAQCFYQFS